ncbi:MAG: hypothetical protein EBW90_12710, partial [Rhodobacteraceae bacterium]|nr:hypothetical protein [Paracoccaceae bacterium]
MKRFIIAIFMVWAFSSNVSANSAILGLGLDSCEKVIENGLNKLLGNYIERHELLEKTHQQLIQLPSIVEELN